MKQKLRFAELYRNNRTAVSKALSAMWCGEARNESQEAYINQLTDIIPEIFAPRDAMPLVQCMNHYESVYEKHIDEAEELMGQLWRKTMPEPDVYYLPYEHQFQCWKTLLTEKSPEGKNMSIVVTTGTGSGKTECFMLPLVKDLLDNYKAGQVQAIFLYPLNALMEDQKARLNRLLEGTPLKFAVYNGDLPERLPNPDDKNYKKVLRKIDAIRGITRDAQGNIIEEKYKNIISTREELRQNPANILLTNPTMLEYILLRDKDNSLIHEKTDEEESSLRWIAIDETHTYTGAGATEIAMLLRRVLLAYGTTTDEIRFATSSATIGNKNGKNVIEEDEISSAFSASSGDDALKLFISKITGLQVNQIRCVDGKRKGLDVLPPEDAEYWKQLATEKNDGYLRLDELISEGNTIEEKLERLDEMCQRAEDFGLDDLRVKVHFFYRVPNHGLFVDMSNPHYTTDGSFKIYVENKIDQEAENASPLLEMSRCKHCGEYIAIAEEIKLNGEIGFQPLSMDDSDMFDLDSSEHSGKTYYVFGTSKNTDGEFDNNVPYFINGNIIKNVTASNPIPAGWHIVANTHCECPYCGTKLTKSSKPDEDNPDAIQVDEEDAKKLQKFRVASDFISRLIAPSTLEQMTEVLPTNGQLILHKGQQYLSFVDSRQNAARATIKQNLEEEKLWLYSTIFHELCRLGTAQSMTKDEAIKYYEEIYNTTDRKDERHKQASEALNILDGDDVDKINKVLAQLTPKQFLSWEDIHDVLMRDQLSDIFCQQFAERSELSVELDENGKILPEIKRKYILAIMVEYLTKRPLSAAAPETMGLFTSHYSKLEPILLEKLPDAVELFNNSLAEENRITKEDWYNLLKIFMDLTVRSNESVFLKMHDSDPIDIFKCVRFATKKERRRPVNKPEIKAKGGNRSRIIRLIARLIANDKNLSITNAISSYRESIQDVIDCLWNELTLKYRLLEHSTHYDDDVHQHTKDKDIVIDDAHLTPYRLNLANLGFKLYKEVYLCDTNSANDNNDVKWLRPTELKFHGYSPYIIREEVVELDNTLSATWEPFPYHAFSNCTEVNFELINEWAKKERKLLWDNNLWGENGTFADRLNQLHKSPDLFIQAEHTAQVDKMISRQVQEDFKSHKINILACSTTMEMGVDLGDLELVMMTSVPPMPSNYKQRAGRSGRRGQVRSACVTLCGSDVIGIRTLLNPLNNVILKEVQTPSVDLNSAQVIQRHINSFLIREFGVFSMAGGSITEQVLHYYTKYQLVSDGDSNHFKIKRIIDNTPVCPIDGLGDETGTPYEHFNNKCSEAISDELRRKLRILLDGTIFSSRSPQYVVNKAKEMNENCYAELELRIQDYAEPYRKAKSAKQQAFFEMKFIEPLANRLLPYWATHRFTPNANMPVNVIEFDINSSSQNAYTLVTTSNPAYPLRTALSQYAPGNPIARDGLVRTVRGIRYTNFFKPEVTFKKLYFNRKQVVIDTKEELDTLEKWKVCGSTELDLLQPVEFIPDMNESANRILDKNVYTRVSAQLIGAAEWAQDRIEPHLFDTRSSREGGNGQILYYNEGTGFGYCHCTKCGKTVLEDWPAAASSDPEKLPSEMNNISSKDTSKPDFHFSLVKKGNKPSKCLGCSNPDYIKRNVVLGDTIQTDYTEIRIRHNRKDWINSRKEEEGLLITLGLLFTQSLAEELNIERSDLDFTITPNGHICVFDANPGGSGYSNQLAAVDIMKDVIDRSHSILKAAKKAESKDALVDKYTLHHINKVDIVEALNWIDEEIAARKVLPENIEQIFGKNVTESSLAKLEKDFVLSQKQRFIFVDDDFKKWQYSGDEHCWKDRFFNQFARFGQQITFCVAQCSHEKMTEPIINMLRSIKGWADEVVHISNPYYASGIYPLAYINDRLYFTINPNHITLNDQWGNGTIYYVRTNNFASGAQSINTDIEENKTVIFKFTDSDTKFIKTSDLGALIESKATGIIENFFQHCKENSDSLISITYQDEHMKSILSIIICLQTIKHFIDKCSNPLTLEFFVEKYNKNTCSKEALSSPIGSNSRRDFWLESLATKMIEKIDETGREVNLYPVTPAPEYELTHWRVLTMECAGKRLYIYPDGGFLNGWFMYNTPTNRQFRDLNNIKYNAEVELTRTQEIKYDVTIEDII